MSDGDPPPDPEFPFNSFGDLSAFANLFSGFGGADPWVQASQIAQAAANGGQSEPNLDPIVRMAYDDLTRVAELHVRQSPAPTLPERTTIRPVTRGEWATTTVELYRPFFERFGEAIRAAADEDPTPAPTDPLAALFAPMFDQLAPMMVSMTAGSMIGHLAQDALGQYDLPVPRPSNDVLVVPTGIDEAAAEWEVPEAEMRLWVLIHELVTHSILSVPHVRRRLDELLIDFATAFRLDTPALTDMFGDLSDMNQLMEKAQQFNDPEVLFSMMRTPAHDLMVPQLDALVAVVLGCTDYLVTSICASLVPSHERIRSRLTERAAANTQADLFMERILGVDITERTVSRGRRFVAGVNERVGAEGLRRLWADELDLPTSAEVDAPGLWIARIGLDPDLPEGAMSVPDDLSGLDDLDS